MYIAFTQQATSRVTPIKEQQILEFLPRVDSKLGNVFAKCPIKKILGK